MSRNNIVFELPNAEGKTERLPTLADELASLKVDLSSLRVVVMVTGDRRALQGIAELRNNFEKRLVEWFRRLEKYLSRDNLKLSEWPSNHGGLSL